MKIAIDSSRSEVDKPTGVMLYSAKIVSGVEKMLLDAGNEVVCYSREHFRLRHDPRATLRVIKPKYFWTLFGLSFEQLRRRCDLIFIPVHVLPLITPKRIVVTVHDVAYLHFPSAYSWRSHLYHRFSMWRIIRQASRIICISEATKNDLIRLCKADPAKLRVVYNGFEVPPEAKPDAPLQEKLFHKLRLKKGEYFIAVGRVEEKKNLVRLVIAFNAAMKANQLHHKLLIVGSPGVGAKRIRERVKSLGIEDKVVFTGYVDEASKWQLLRGAVGLCFPSLYEGFGYPILEGYAAGIPVMTSNTSSLPELTGPKGAIFVDPQDPEDISRGILELIGDTDKRNKLIEIGRERLSRFTWEESVRQTNSVIEELVNER
jgi:glycosyltransferase involved in cell wall biosynthesis